MRALNYHEKRKKKHKHLSKRKKRLLIILIVLLVTAGIGIGAFEILMISGKSGLKKNSPSSLPDLTKAEAVVGTKNSEQNSEQSSEQSDQESNEKEYDPTIFHYKGNTYKYNENIITILCMGIGSNEGDITFENSSDSRRADLLFLLILDPRTKEMKLIGIPKNTMASPGNDDTAHGSSESPKSRLGLVYNDGDGGEESGELMVQTVSGLFYDLPIHGYISVLMNAIPTLNDAVGGVPVTVNEDLTQYDPALTQGAQVRLMGNQALYYVTDPDADMGNSDGACMERQKQYAISFINQTKQAAKANPSLTVNIFSELSSVVLMNMGIDNAVYLTSEGLGMHFDMENIVSVEGTTETKGGTDEFYVDEEKLLQLILDVFYIKE